VVDDEQAAEDGDEHVVETPTRHRQAQILRELAARLEAGEPMMPTDVLGVVLRELELRADDDAIHEANAEQGERKAEPWVFCRGRARG
jgi:hypothetical protein